MPLMDADDIGIFINNLELKLSVYSFDTLVQVPASFSSLGEINIATDTAWLRSLNLREPSAGYRGYGKPLRNFLKTFKEKRNLKRKLSTFDNEATSKQKKYDTHQLERTDTDQKDAEVMSDQSAEQEHLHGEKKEEEEDDQIDFSNRKLKEALEHLNAFLDETNLNALKRVIKSSRDEDELVTGLGIHLISKLAGVAYTSKKNSPQCCPCGCQEKLPEKENMWIGTENTWYGELDLLAGNSAIGESVSVTVKNNDAGSEIETQKDDEGYSDVEDYPEGKAAEKKEENPCDGTNNEMKFNGLIDALNEVISQAVVFAFTEYNRHKDKGYCIPSILLDRSTFQYVIYSPVDDILLVSNHMVFTSPEDFDRKTGYRPFVVLWMILNHRLFFKKCPDFKNRFVKSGFHGKMKNLEAFQNLADYSDIISLNRNYNFANDTPKTIGCSAMEWFLDKCNVL